MTVSSKIFNFLFYIYPNHRRPKLSVCLIKCSHIAQFKMAVNIKDLCGNSDKRFK